MGCYFDRDTEYYVIKDERLPEGVRYIYKLTKKESKKKTKKELKGTKKDG